MKNLSTFLFLCIVLLGCKEISFTEPQPKGKKSLAQIPQSLRGTYLLQEQGGSSQDTLKVSGTGYYIASDKTHSELGDSLVLKKYKGYYFVNINENPEWLLRIIKQEENGDLTYMSMEAEEDSFNDLLNDLATEVGLDSVQLEDEKLYQIDPSPKELLNLIEKGYFKKKFHMQKLK